MQVEPFETPAFIPPSPCCCDPHVIHDGGVEGGDTVPAPLEYGTPEAGEVASTSLRCEVIGTPAPTGLRQHCPHLRGMGHQRVN